MPRFRNQIFADGLLVSEVVISWTHETLSAAIAEYRYQQEIAGITVGGVPISTERGDHRIVMHTIRTEARANSEFTVGLKTSAGIVPMDAATIMAVTGAMLWYINACFVRESELLTALAASEDLDSIADDMLTGWPGREF